MNYMVNMMREHMDERARIHYVIKKGGLAANVVPDYVEMEYYVRHPNVQGVLELFDRVVKCGEGAAIGTETKMEVDVNFGLYDLLPNDVLAKVMHENLTRVGGVKYNADELAFANKIRESFPYKIPNISFAADIQPFATDKNMSGSTDVGDVSYIVPTVGVYPATWVPGTAAHTWQATAADGMGIGFKGMMVAAKSMAMTGVDMFSSPELLTKAKAELQKRTDGFKYKALVGDRKPPLDYRKGL
jgi:aminobenzoyl-glutamate utilization protein B